MMRFAKRFNAQSRRYATAVKRNKKKSTRVVSDHFMTGPPGDEIEREDTAGSHPKLV